MSTLARTAKAHIEKARPRSLKRMVLRLTALATATVAALTLTAGSSSAASRAIDIYFHNYGAYTAQLNVFEGQFPRGGENNNKVINGRAAVAGQSAYFRAYLDDVNGWTARGNAMGGRTSYFVFGQGSASTVCFRFDGTTIIGFKFNITGC